MRPFLLATVVLALSSIHTTAKSGGGFLGGGDDCATPTMIGGQGTVPFDNTNATAGAEGQNESLCLYAGVSAIDHDVWFEWTAPCSGIATLTTCTLGTTVDTKIGVYPGPGCPADGTALDCDEDSCGPNQFESEINWSAVFGSTYTIQIGTFPGAAGGTGTFSLSVTPCTDQTTAVCLGDGSGAGCPCGNSGSPGQGCANGSGQGGLLESTGTVSISAGDLVLEASNLIAGQPGLFFQGENEINNGDGVVFGDGLRCCGMNVVRLEVVTADANGRAASTVEVAASGGVSPGDRRCYQHWYRDPNTTTCGFGFNLTNGLAVDWLP